MKFKDLLLRAKSGDQDAIHTILEMYRPLLSQANGGRQEPLPKQRSGPFGQVLHSQTLSKMICLRR